DSGVQADHPDLIEQVVEQVNLATDRPLLPELHGTAVAGIIAAREGNQVGIAGVAPLARIVGLRACWQLSASNTRCNSLSLALALSAALERNVQVINMSLAGPHDRLIQRFIEAAQGRGIAVVAARDGAARDGGFPASMKGVIAVSETPPPLPGHGVAAPGTDVLTTLPPSRWGIVSGSSYAAAHVSGLVALVLEARSRQGTMPVRAPAGGIELVSGTDGRVDACATLQRATSACVCACGDAAAMADSVARP
ncbi:MAG TPA: S8 family serine peptidase, partial [Candidatus Limnocylindrales bacterium]